MEQSYYKASGKMWICRSVDIHTCKMQINIFCHGLRGKMRMRIDFYVLFILKRHAYMTEKLLRTEDCIYLCYYDIIHKVQHKYKFF